MDCQEERFVLGSASDSMLKLTLVPYFTKRVAVKLPCSLIDYEESQEEVSGGHCYYDAVDPIENTTMARK